MNGEKRKTDEYEVERRVVRWLLEPDDDRALLSDEAVLIEGDERAERYRRQLREAGLRPETQS